MVESRARRVTQRARLRAQRSSWQNVCRGAARSRSMAWAASISVRQPRGARLGANYRRSLSVSAWIPLSSRRLRARGTLVMDLIGYIDSKREEHLNELKEFLRIPSVSATSEHKKDIE